ncbi:MAG: S-layer homology domain-containing protein [Oscillospiraceae bacterium]|nr:S-layer homology domain-containing protein [Oscillospiraceae bacterium]
MKRFTSLLLVLLMLLPTLATASASSPLRNTPVQLELSEPEPVETVPLDSVSIGSEAIETGSTEVESMELGSAAVDVQKSESEPSGFGDAATRQDEFHRSFISGMPDGCFYPYLQITRAEIAVILYALGNYEQGPTCFTDVPENTWYTDAVNALAAAGIVTPDADGNFRPSDYTTRAQLVYWLAAISGEACPTTTTFPDVPADYWAHDAICLAQEKGWTVGFPDGTFGPEKSISRAETVLMINKFASRCPDTETIDTNGNVRFFPDVEVGSWYYYAVIEAATSHTAHYIEDNISEHWLDPRFDFAAQLTNGFYCINGNLYAVENGMFVHSAGTRSFNNITYTCAGSSGICTVQTEVLSLVDGNIVLLNGGSPIAAPGNYSNGFYAKNSKLYVAKNGYILHTSCTDSCNGISYTCTGSSGICTARTEVLTLVNGDLVLVSGGNPIRQPGNYDNGVFFIKAGHLFVAQNGYILHSNCSGSINGVAYTCTGASGYCSVADWTLLQLSRINLGVFSQSLTPEASASGSTPITTMDILRAAVRAYEAYFRVDFPLRNESDQVYIAKALEYDILDQAKSSYSSTVNYGEAAMYLWRAFRGRELGAINNIPNIPGVDSSNRYYRYLMSFYQAGVMTGIGAEHMIDFSVPVTVTDLAQLLTRLERISNRVRFTIPTEVIKTIQYGTSGSGRYPLTAYQIGDGKNVMVLSFALHGWEDNWDRDGEALVYLADQFDTYLEDHYDLVRDGDWTVYILRCLNPDGIYLGTTCNGPGRCTTTHYNSNGQLVSGGIDMNRCFPYNFRCYTGDRNYNGSAPLACAEARAISDFVSNVKGSGHNILIDTHGWFSQIITSSGYGTIYDAFHKQFPGNTYASLSGGNGYFSSWAAYVKGYDSCLLELPDIYSYSAFLSSGCVGKYQAAIVDLLQHYNGPSSTKAASVEEAAEPVELDGN